MILDWLTCEIEGLMAMLRQYHDDTGFSERSLNPVSTVHILSHSLVPLVSLQMLAYIIHRFKCLVWT